ncbi:hydroxymethylglutaryl-CoA synthase [Nocardia sp. CDC159]|uniref:Hydroxymethylglutaryl-CoA synthase n=1 Tax=Nocardia pulmonis TaxID=2951408 RepID=A0A9X2ED26_9NOCA|nr:MULTISPECIES: hydroxymethylglutaryl-CoA synthase [Nocardia]MCM6778677.1 hydroxymethylglutaryl-CoA synthase [Nocardia pulmonis]MCM6791566.1 hydroxymethylglutaryl-CoA synthase [Nocardia sp. CDC159]
MHEDFPVGIHDISFATGHYVLEHRELARHTGVDVDKYHLGIGQEAMSLPAADEDIVTMAAAAAWPIIDRHGTAEIRTVLLATETAVDQAKSAGLYVHSLLGLPSAARVLELKQACYGATAALQFAAALVCRDPAQRVLVIATDVAKYDLDSPGEPTQGAAATAMLVTADPAILRLDSPSGLFAADIMDFWRPNYRSTAVVDGKMSVTAYLQAVEGAWKDYVEQGGRPIQEFAAFCYHQPFTKMAFKAHRHLAEFTGLGTESDHIHDAIHSTTIYNRVIGNSYTASLYVGLASLLDHRGDLADRPIALFSYGSGSVAEFFGGTVVPGYRDQMRTAAHRSAIADRRPIDYLGYRSLHEMTLPTDGGDHALVEEALGPFRLAGLSGHKRIYQVRPGDSRQ